MKRSLRILVPVAALVAVLPLNPAAALDHTWSWAGKYTDVSRENRTFAHRQPNVQNGQQSVHELSARRDRHDHSKGRAEAAIKTRFEAVQADNLEVRFFGRVREADNEPLARLKVYVHCQGELEDEWVLIGRKEVAPNTTGDLIKRTITAEDCETQTHDGVMLQVLTGERGDRKRRTVYLKSAELRFGAAATWTENFTTP